MTIAEGSPHCFTVSNHTVLTMLLLARVWGDFWYVILSRVCEDAVACLSEVAKISVGFFM